MIIKGRVHRFGNNVTTDDIIAGKYKNRILELDELVQYTMENLVPGFYGRFHAGDLIVAGRNFGAGSSREAAPAVLRRLGCAAVIARSFARIFYRNSFNIGLRLIECETDGIEEGDRVQVDLRLGVLTVKNRHFLVEFNPPPTFMNLALEEGGLVAHFKKHGGFNF